MRPKDEWVRSGDSMAARIITVAQQKGGSGKTTLTVNLAVALRRKGFRVAVLDTDPQGSLGRWFMERLQAIGEDGALDAAIVERGPTGSDTSACNGAVRCGRTIEWRRRSVRRAERGSHE